MKPTDTVSIFLEASYSLIVLKYLFESSDVYNGFHESPHSLFIEYPISNGGFARLPFADF